MYVKSGGVILKQDFQSSGGCCVSLTSSKTGRNDARSEYTGLNLTSFLQVANAYLCMIREHAGTKARNMSAISKEAIGRDKTLEKLQVPHQNWNKYNVSDII